MNDLMQVRMLLGSPAERWTTQNFQQRVNSTKNEEGEQADDVLTMKAFRDTWALGIHSYLSYFCVNDCISAASCSRPAGSADLF